MLDYARMYHGDRELKRLYHGDALVWEKPAPAYDESRITVMLLDESDEPGELFGVYDSISSVQGVLAGQVGTGRRFYVYIGENAGITVMGAPSAGGQGTLSGITSPFMVRLPRCITELGINSFSNSTGLMMPVLLPNNLTALGNSAFNNCVRLTSIIVPSSVMSINEYAFYFCSNLAEITVNKPQGSIIGAPWGATNATVTWTG